MTVPGATLNPQRRASSIGIAVLLFGFVVWAFFPATRNGFIGYDDALFVTANTQVQGGVTWDNTIWAFRNPVAANWHPLTTLSHMLDCQLYGMKPWGHHLTSVLLHAATTVLLFWVFHQMTGAVWRPAALAALFALHPLRVESVAWVTERKDVLSTLFLMLTLWAYERYVENAECRMQNAERRREKTERGADKSETRRRQLNPAGYYALALAFFVLGLMSKPMVVTLPFVLLLLDYWPLKRNAECRMQNAEVGSQNSECGTRNAEPGPGGIIPGSGHALDEAGPGEAAFLRSERRCQRDHFPGATGGWRGGNQPAAGRAARQCAGFLLAICWKTIMAGEPVGVLSASGAVAGVADDGCGGPAARDFWGGDPAGAEAALSGGWLALVLRHTGAGDRAGPGGSQSMADRYSYVPSIGVFLMLVWGVHELFAPRRYRTVALSVLAVAVTFLCLALTRRQIGWWKDEETLWLHALAVAKNNNLANYNLGVVYFNLGVTLAERGAFHEAIQEYEKAIRLDPGRDDAHSSLAYALLKTGRVAEAIREYELSLRLDPRDAEAHNNLGNILARQGRVEEATQHLTEALRLRPAYPEAHDNLGSVLAAQGRYTEAAAEFREVLRLKPDYPGAAQKLERVLAEQRRLEWGFRALAGRSRTHDECLPSALLGDRAWHERRAGALSAGLKTCPARRQVSPRDLDRFGQIWVALRWPNGVAFGCSSALELGPVGRSLGVGNEKLPDQPRPSSGIRNRTN